MNTKDAIKLLAEVLEEIRAGHEAVMNEDNKPGDRYWTVDPYGELHDLEANKNRDRFWGWFEDAPDTFAAITTDGLVNASQLLDWIEKRLPESCPIRLYEQAYYTIGAYIEAA